MCAGNLLTPPAFRVVGLFSLAVDPLLAKGATMLHPVVRVKIVLKRLDTWSEVAELAPLVARAYGAKWVGEFVTVAMAAV